MHHIPFLDLKWTHSQIKDNLAKRWDKLLENTAFAMGEEVRVFEENFAKYCGTKHCIAVANGTSALSLAIRALKLPSKSEIITLPTSFFASASAIVHAGHTPVFAEVDIHTANFNFAKLDKAVTPKTKAIMAVHLYGRMADMDKVVRFAKKHKLIVIEDAAQAQGATYKKKRAGSIGTVGCFSFYPGKNLGAYGEAGAIVTNDDVVMQHIKKLRDHGCIKKYEHEELGYNERMDNLQAAVLDEKLKHLDKWNKMRQVVAKKYYQAFSRLKNISIISPNTPNDISVHHLFAIRIKNREMFMQEMKDLGVATSIHYPHALHTLPVLQQSKCRVGDFPIAEKIAAETVSLPIFPGMTEDQVRQVILAVKKVCNK